MDNLPESNFMESLPAEIADELNLTELESLMSTACTSNLSTQLLGTSDFNLRQVTASSNSNPSRVFTASQQRSALTISNSANDNGASFGNVIARTSNQAPRILLNDPQPTAPNQLMVQGGASLHSSSNPSQEGDVSKTLLQLIIRQQIQQNEQQQILERLQKAVLGKESVSNRPTASASASEKNCQADVLPSLPVEKPKPTIATVTGASNSTVSQLKATVVPHTVVNRMHQAAPTPQAQSSSHILALLEKSPPPPIGTTMQQYSHLSQSELRQTLINTDNQLQMKSGVRSASSNFNHHSAATQSQTQLQPQAKRGVDLHSSNSSSVWQAEFASNASSPGFVFAQPTRTPLVTKTRSGSASVSAFASAIDAESVEYQSTRADLDAAGEVEIETELGSASGTGTETGTGTGTGPQTWTTRRSSHNVVEKRYRSSINDRIDELRQLVAADQTKLHKSGILRKTIDCIHHLRSQNTALRNENAALKRAMLSLTASSAPEADVKDPSLAPIDSSAGPSSAASASSARSNGNGPSTVSRTQMLLCVAMLTVVAANPLERWSPSGPQFSFQPDNVHTDFSVPHVGSRILNSFIPIGPDTSRTGSSPTWLYIAIWSVNFITLYGALYLASTCRKSNDAVRINLDRYKQLLAEANAAYCHGQYEEAKKTYILALQSVGYRFGSSLLLDCVGLLLGIRRRASVTVEPSDLCLVYSRLLLSSARVSEQTELTTPRVVVTAFRDVLALSPIATKSKFGQRSVAEAYMSIAFTALLCCKRSRRSSIGSFAARFVLRFIGKSAFTCVHRSAGFDIFQYQDLTNLIFDSGELIEEHLPNSIVNSLVIAHLRAVLANCFAAMRDNDAKMASASVIRLSQVHSKLQNSSLSIDLKGECDFWLAALRLFVGFNGVWRDIRCSSAVKDLRQRGLLRLSFVECATYQSGDRSVWQVMSPRAVTIACLLQQAVESLDASDSDPDQTSVETLTKLRSCLNSLSRTLRSLNLEQTNNCLEMNLARCAARWLLGLRVLQCEYQRKFADVSCLELSRSRTPIRTGGQLKKVSSRLIGEFQTDLDTLVELNSRCRGRRSEWIENDQMELAHFEAFLHGLANSNPLGGVFVRLRVFAS